jgi:hypothetical protein
VRTVNANCSPLFAQFPELHQPLQNWKSERSKRAREWGCVRTIAVFARELSAETRARPADVQPSPSPVRKRKTSHPKDDLSSAAVAGNELPAVGNQTDFISYQRPPTRGPFMFEIFKTLSDDQIALVGCAAALTVAGTIMSLSYYIGRGRMTGAGQKISQPLVLAASIARPQRMNSEVAAERREAA